MQYVPERDPGLENQDWDSEWGLMMEVNVNVGLHVVMWECALVSGKHTVVFRGDGHHSGSLLSMIQGRKTGKRVCGEGGDK